MQGALVILAVLAAVGLLLFYLDRRKPRHGHQTATRDDAAAEPVTEPDGEVCCGLHAICEKKYAVPADEPPVYYDDEELDALANRNPDSYTEAELEQLRDVVMTLRSEDAWGWSRSLQQRHIALPPEIRDELMLLIGN